MATSLLRRRVSPSVHGTESNWSVFAASAHNLMTKCLFQSAARLEADQKLATSSPSDTRPPEHLSQLRQLAQDVIKTAQASEQGAESTASSAWLNR
jgi:hypothetical protein